MFKNALLALALLFCSCCPPKAVKQTPIHEVHSTVVWIDEPVREVLRKDWTDVDPNQLERKYCVAYGIELNEMGDSVFTIHAIARAKGEAATQGTIRGNCPKDGHTLLPLFVHFTDIHVHPPTTCEHSQEEPFHNCAIGGLEAWECFPSSKDWAYLLDSGYRFALLQCAKDALVPYFVHPYWTK